MKTRGFEVVTTYTDKGIALPARKTGCSAGYDLAAAEDVLLAPNRVTLVPTGLKAYMQPDEYLGIHVRSGFSIRNLVSCVNDEGIIDADYYDNAENEGHILVSLLNHSEKVVTLDKGKAFVQGIFVSYDITRDDQVETIRTGGIGSSDLRL